jgi:hypothetical protein
MEHADKPQARGEDRGARRLGRAPALPRDLGEARSPSLSGPGRQSPDFGLFGLSRKTLFFALTFVLVIIIAIMCPDLSTALAVIGLLLGFYVAYLAGGGAPVFPSFGARPPEPAREGYYPLPGASAPYAAAAAALPPADAGHYPGAIDIDEYDSEAAYGYRDRTEGDNDGVPVGNPFGLSRISAPPAAEACVDDEANDAEIDGDESMVYNALGRNDPQRPTAGTMNRRRDLQKDLEEEVEMQENRQWWGRHEV